MILLSNHKKPVTIRLATDQTKEAVYDMWDACFSDDGGDTDLHFSKNYRNENTLICFEDDIPVASFQAVACDIEFYQSTLPVMYLCGLCTLSRHQNNGYATMLVNEMDAMLRQRGCILTTLIPATESLFHFYYRLGYIQIFLEKGMAKILNPNMLMFLYAHGNPSIRIGIKTGEYYYLIDDSGVKSSKQPEPRVEYVEADMRLLCRLLFGYHTSYLDEPFKSLFPERTFIHNFLNDVS
jgi:ribosomal protein S18 acetylase RimI-like enzyme